MKSILDNTFALSKTSTNKFQNTTIPSTAADTSTVMTDGGTVLTNPNMGSEALGVWRQAIFGWNPVISQPITITGGNITSVYTFNNNVNGAVIPYFDSDHVCQGVLTITSATDAATITFTTDPAKRTRVPQTGDVLLSPEYDFTVCRCSFRPADIVDEDGVFDVAAAEKINGVKIVRELNRIIDLGWIDRKKKQFTSGLNLDPGLSNTSSSRLAHSGLVQAASSTSITLASGASTTDGKYNGYVVYITKGKGVGQIRTASTDTTYNGTTKVLTVTQAWDTTPDGTSTYLIMKYRAVPDYIMTALLASDNNGGLAYPTSFSTETTVAGFSFDYTNEDLIAFHKECLDALGAAYKNDPLLNRVYAGSIGKWGEWHVDPLKEPTLNTKTSQNSLEAQALPATQIMLAADSAYSDYTGCGVYVNNVHYRHIDSYDPATKIATLNATTGETSNANKPYVIQDAGMPFPSNAVVNQYLQHYVDAFGNGTTVTNCEIRRPIGSAGTMGFGFQCHSLNVTSQVYSEVGGGIDSLKLSIYDKYGNVQSAVTDYKTRHLSGEAAGTMTVGGVEVENDCAFANEPTNMLDDLEWESGAYTSTAGAACTKSASSSFMRISTFINVSAGSTYRVKVRPGRYVPATLSEGYSVRIYQVNGNDGDKVVRADSISDGAPLTMNASTTKIGFTITGATNPSFTLSAADVTKAFPRLYAVPADPDPGCMNINIMLQHLTDYPSLLYCDDLSCYRDAETRATQANITTFLNKLGYRLGTTVKHKSKVNANTWLPVELIVHNIGVAYSWLPNYKLEISLLAATGHAVAWSSVIDCPTFAPGDTSLEMFIPTDVATGNYHIAVAIYHPSLMDDLYVSLYGGTAAGMRTIISDVEVV